jgi:hypothetical protein
MAVKQKAKNGSRKRAMPAAIANGNVAGGDPPATQYFELKDGSWLECDPIPGEESYRCHPVPASEVPASVGGEKHGA